MEVELSSTTFTIKETVMWQWSITNILEGTIFGLIGTMKGWQHPNWYGILCQNTTLTGCDNEIKFARLRRAVYYTYFKPKGYSTNTMLDIFLNSKKETIENI